MELRSLRQLIVYFLKLGGTGFGGPVALANAMRRDLVERRAWFREDEYDRGLAIATVCPGPIAYQLGVYFGYLRYGIRGAIAIGLAFACLPFFFVLGFAEVYTHFQTTTWVRSIFYGVSPVVVALIARASWNLGIKTLKRDASAWLVATIAFVITLAFSRELTALFIGAGLLGIWIFAPKQSSIDTRDGSRESQTGGRNLQSNALFSFLLMSSRHIPLITWKLFAFFFKTGFFVFGSGLVVVSFMKTNVVDRYHWISDRAFLDAVAIGMASPGPVVVTATFVGFLTNGISGAVAATLGMFLPSVILTVLATPLLLRIGENTKVAGFVRGVTVSVVGVLAATTYLVGRPVVGDWLTIVLILGVLILQQIWKRIPGPIYVMSGACIGIVAYPLMNPIWMK